jgi:hypothetical protein
MRYKLFNVKRIGFGSLLEDTEAVEAVFRKEFSSTFAKMLFYCLLWGGVAGVIWYVFRFYAFWEWIELIFIVFALYKVMCVFFVWYFNAILMTTDNLLFVEWKGLFNKKSSRIDYWNLDEIQVVRIGIRSFMGNYGDLFFMKYNGGVLYEAHRIHAPQKVARTIENYREQQVDAKNFTEESSLKELISGLVQTHVRDKGQPERDEKVSKRPESGASLNVEPRKGKEKKSIIKKVFHPDEMAIEVEKELDDEGGIEIDL